MMRAAVCALLVLLGGCGAGFDYALEYGPEFKRYKDGNDNWRVFDRPDNGKLMITPSIGRAFALSQAPKPQFQAAVEGWLVSTGRECVITDSYLIIEPQWEFKYRCATPPVPRGS